MQVVKPLNFEVLENDFKKEDLPFFDENKTYLIDEVVQFEGNIYQNASEEVDNLAPNLSLKKWVKMKPCNENAFFDDKVHSISKNDKKTKIKIKLNENFNTLAFLNLKASFIKIEDEKGALIFEKSLLSKKSFSWWEYFFKPFRVEKDEFIFLPYLMQGVFTITLEKVDEVVELGFLLVGKREFLGVSVYPANFSYLNYSKTKTDEWGNTSFSKGRKARYAEFLVSIDKSSFDYFDEKISELYNEAALFIGDERQKGFKRLSIYGLLKDYSAPLDEYDTISYKLNIQGLI